MKITKFIPITKVNDEERMVYGWASTPDLDSDGEVITIDALAKALPEYMRFPSLREMHQPKVAGVTRSAEVIDDHRGRGLFIGAKVVSDEAWKLVKEGAYKAFSIGGEVLNRVNNVINDLRLLEISLVDVPANPNAIITVYKASKSELKRIESLKRIKFDTPLEEGFRRGVIHYMEKNEEVETTKEVEATEEVTEEVADTKEVETETTVEATEESQEAEKIVSVDEKLEKVDELITDEAKETVEETKEDPIAKSVSNMGKDINKVADTVVKMAQAIKSMHSRIVALENQPMPTKAKAAFVGKVEGAKDDSDVASKKARLIELDALLEKMGKTRFAQAGYANEAQRLQEEILLNQ